MNTISPAPFPTNAVRHLSPKEIMQRAKALACTIPADRLSTCSGQVFVGHLFAGTGHSNEAFQVAQHIHVEAVTPAVEAFFDRYIHDSEAGFMATGMDEYVFNGIGITKFRTVYVGNA